MARKMSSFAATMSNPEICRKLLIAFAALLVAVPWLLKMIPFSWLLVAAVLTLPAIFLWKHRVVRVIMRTVLCLLMAAVPVLLIVVAAMGYFYVEYFVLFLASAWVLPTIAVAANNARRFDIILLRIAAALNTVEAALIMAYIFTTDQWVKIALFGAVNLCFAVLAVMSFPPDLTPLREKMKAARAKYED